VTQASVKGLLLGGVVVNVRRLCERGSLTDADLEARLTRPAIALLGEKIDPALWYPLDAYRELVDLLWQVEGGKNPDYMREKGRAWAKKLYDAHRYQQLEYSAEHASKVDSDAEAVRQGRLIASLVQTFWNFVETRVDLDPDRPHTLRMTIDGTAPLPDANRYTTEGFLNHMVERGGGTARASSERPRPNRVVFRLPLRTSR
jgi:hypothetical protein